MANDTINKRLVLYSVQSEHKSYRKDPYNLAQAPGRKLKLVKEHSSRQVWNDRWSDEWDKYISSETVPWITQKATFKLPIMFKSQSTLIIQMSLCKLIFGLKVLHISTNLYASLSFCGCPDLASTGAIQAPHKVPWQNAEFMAVKLGHVSCSSMY